MGAVAEKYATHIILTDDNPRWEDSQQIIDPRLNLVECLNDADESDRGQTNAHHCGRHA